MPKFQLLLLDANIVIYLHELGIWDRFTELCDVTLASSVAFDEAQFWEDDEGEQHHFNSELKSDIDNEKIKCVKVAPQKCREITQQFFYKIDPGEAESLAFLLSEKEEWLISSGDAVVFKVLGRLSRGHQGISLEEILQQIGLSRELRWDCTKKFREKYTRMGEQDSITGTGLK